MSNHAAVLHGLAVLDRTLDVIANTARKFPPTMVPPEFKALTESNLFARSVSTRSDSGDIKVTLTPPRWLGGDTVKVTVPADLLNGPTTKASAWTRKAIWAHHHAEGQRQRDAALQRIRDAKKTAQQSARVNRQNIDDAVKAYAELIGTTVADVENMHIETVRVSTKISGY